MRLSRCMCAGSCVRFVLSLTQRDIKTASWLGHLANVAPLFSAAVFFFSFCFFNTVNSWGGENCWMQFVEMPLASVAKLSDEQSTQMIGDIQWEHEGCGGQRVLWFCLNLTVVVVMWQVLALCCL